jgi:hypothetical protein
MPRSSKSREWLGEALACHRPTEGDLRQLVIDCPHEDEHLDYKAGKLLADPRAAAAAVREYASAFGNAEGGTLLIGYDRRGQIRRSEGTGQGLARGVGRVGPFRAGAVLRASS